ncbi:gamma-glutamylcyclotransferase [Myxococcus sp. K15C18031901]|uniref:gamma-glutamylcyclotransferase n=1 Tax=Myxococcus dinghuensis TaxID=2906761 RepID=UPI0020A7B30F|nr:gamma-glutamylcyclotransferase [Myxococcus dinghuensis]MCP3098845.1 gamma-glutamylcyclotransferase [Myxococcus dinghuensis]
MSSAPQPWFAFSLDLAPGTARERLPSLPPTPALPDGELAEALDVEVVYDVDSATWGGRVARLVDAPGKSLPGLLRRLPSAAQWEAVVRMEAALSESTSTRPVKVRTATGATLVAQAFTPPGRTGSGAGTISESFLVTVALAAERAGLSPDHVERLQAEARIVQTVQQARASTLPQGRKP